VTSNPPGIDCGATCSATLAGTVTLTATADVGSVFAGWSGCDSVAANVCTVDITSDRTVTASFDQGGVSPLVIPTLGVWALVLLAVTLAFLGWTVLRR
jgi:hypothetical protein